MSTSFNIVLGNLKESTAVASVRNHLGLVTTRDQHCAGAQSSVMLAGGTIAVSSQHQDCELVAYFHDVAGIGPFSSSQHKNA